MSGNIVGILLAAGQSARFGSNKLLQRIPGSQHSLAVQAAQHLLQALPDSVAVVNNNQSLQSQLKTSGINVVTNEHATSGISSSIITGINHASHADGWVITLADMPFVPAQIISQVAHALKGGALLAAPQYRQRRGHPVGFSRSLRDELLMLSGDTGAKVLIKKYQPQLHIIKTSSTGILQDVDHPEDLLTFDEL